MKYIWALYRPQCVDSRHLHRPTGGSPFSPCGPPVNQPKARRSDLGSGEPDYAEKLRVDHEREFGITAVHAGEDAAGAIIMRQLRR